MKNKTIFVMMLCLLFSSCKTKDIIAIPMSDEMYQINSDFSDGNLLALIQDYEKYPEYKEYTYNVIFGDIDFSIYTYSELLDFKDHMSNLDLKEGLKNIIEQRQQFIINDLSKKTVEELIIHYKENQNQHDFLDDYINSTLVVNIGNMEYSEIKYLSYLFENTKFHKCFFEKRMELKTKMLSRIKSDIDIYIKSELELINYLDIALRAYLVSYLHEKYPIIINEIIDMDFPEKKMI